MGMMNKHFICYLLLSDSKTVRYQKLNIIRDYAVSSIIDRFYTIIETKSVNTEQNILFSRTNKKYTPTLGVIQKI